MDIGLIVILFIWGILVPFIGIRLIFFGGFRSKQEVEVEDDDFYWEKKPQKSQLIDTFVGLAFLGVFAIFLYLVISEGLLNPLIFSLRF
jgi:hypothetical protein